jgi:uncharacterized protein (DUF2062 family)
MANFWIRLQTGKVLRDAGSTVRVYPVHVPLHLRLRARGWAAGIEILVKSLWAGVPVLEVLIDKRSLLPHGRSMRRSAAGVLLNLHYTLRSITPIPHRKIVGDADTGRKISVVHPVRSLRTLLTENTTPGRIAAAGALGVFLGTLPLIACHTVAILFAAGYFRLNKVAAVGASQLCMPPVVPALCVEAGYLMRHGRFLTEISMETLGYQALERLFEWALGALVLAPALALIIGGVIYGMAIGVRKAGKVED